MKEILSQYQAILSSLGEGEACVSFCERLLQTIQEIIDYIPQDLKVGIRPAGLETKKLLEQFKFREKQIVGIIDREKQEDTYCGYPCFSEAEFSAENVDIVFVSSFRYRESIKEDLERAGIPYIDPYDALNEYDIELIAPFYEYSADCSLVLNVFYRKYLKRKEDGNVPLNILRDLLQAAVEQKDFITISKIYNNNKGPDGKCFYPLLQETWSKIQTLLENIKIRIEERDQNDIFMFFADAVPVSMLKDLPETNKLSKQSLYFQRAYTHTPYTNSTLRAIFRKELPIDDYDQYYTKINGSNSPLLSYLGSKNYRILFCSHVRSLDNQYFTGDYCENTNCNIKWWDGLLALLQSKEPCFCMFHFVAETHPPHYFPYCISTLLNPYRKSAQLDVQTKSAFAYFDQCLSLYSTLAGKKLQIFFSDHGTAVKDYESWSENTLHPFCFVRGEGIPVQKISKIFPYKSFSDLIQWILEPEKGSLDAMCHDEIVFQDVDIYNSSILDGFIKQGLLRRGISYRGVLTDKYKYVINALGEEFFYHMESDDPEFPVELTDEDLRAELQKKCGTNFIDIYQNEKFKHSRKLYEYIKARTRSGEA